MIVEPPTDAAEWAELRSLQRQLGVTRLADLTGLDRAGVPVVQAVRPLSKSNAVSQGKGATLFEAARSALMESAESFFAERIERQAVTVASATALGIAGDLYDFHADPDVARRWRDWEIAWVPARNLLDGSATHVPLELVHTAYVVPPSPYDGVFRTSTTGLAVAACKARAVRHGLLECIERDAISRALGRHRFLQDNRIAPQEVQSPELDALVAALRGKGFLVGLWLAPTAGGIPVVWCHLMEDCDADRAILPNPAEGSAARMTIAAAAMAALREAAQSRLTALSGARDDMGRGSYRDTPRDRAKRDAHRRLLAEGDARMTVPASADASAQKAESAVAWLLDRLRCAGISLVGQVDLDTLPVSGLHAVRIVVPQLHPLFDG